MAELKKNPHKFYKNGFMTIEQLKALAQQSNNESSADVRSNMVHELEVARAANHCPAFVLEARVG
jgi:hypothetical protein